MPLLWALLFFILAFVQCNRPQEPSPELNSGRTYFEIQKNAYTIYDVVKYRFSFAEPTDSQYYQLKVVYGDTFTTQNGQTAHRLFRYKRCLRSTRQPTICTDTTWMFDSLWYVRSESNEVLYYENNIPYVRATFPLQSGKSWDGNRYNNLGKQVYKVTALGPNRIYNSETYTQTLEITQSNDSNALELRVQKRVYAPKIGLIAYEYRWYDDACKYNFENKPCIPGSKIATGTIYSQQITDYGFE